jgi:hypothetical protein
VSTYLLGGDLAFPDELVECGFWDLQVGRQLFDGQYIIWFFIHRAHLSSIKTLFNRNTSYLFCNLQLLTIVVERFPESKAGAWMCGPLAEGGADMVRFLAQDGGVGSQKDKMDGAGQSRVERSLWRDLRLDRIPAFAGGSDAIDPLREKQRRYSFAG